MGSNPTPSAIYIVDISLSYAFKIRLFKFSLSPPAATLEQALAALKKQLLLAYLWGEGHDSVRPRS